MKYEKYPFPFLDLIFHRVVQETKQILIFQFGISQLQNTALITNAVTGTRLPELSKLYEGAPL